jgi:hypothetical protein
VQVISIGVSVFTYISLIAPSIVIGTLSAYDPAAPADAQAVSRNTPVNKTVVAFLSFIRKPSFD